MNRVEWVRVDRCDDLGTIIFETRGSKSIDDYRKSSRYVYLHDRKLFGEIISIYEHFENEQELIWFSVDAFDKHSIDPETLLPHAIINSSKTIYI